MPIPAESPLRRISTVTDFILPKSKPNRIRELVPWMRIALTLGATLSKINNVRAQNHPLPVGWLPP